MPGLSQTLTGMSADREQLTRLTRSLAADLDELDRQLSDLTWRQRSLATTPADHEGSAMLARREQLTSRLLGFARQLNDLDATLSNLTGQPERPADGWESARTAGIPAWTPGCAHTVAPTWRVKLARSARSRRSAAGRPSQ